MGISGKPPGVNGLKTLKSDLDRENTADTVTNNVGDKLQ